MAVRVNGQKKNIDTSNFYSNRLRKNPVDTFYILTTSQTFRSLSTTSRNCRPLFSSVGANTPLRRFSVYNSYDG